MVKEKQERKCVKYNDAGECIEFVMVGSTPIAKIKDDVCDEQLRKDAKEMLKRLKVNIED